MDEEKIERQAEKAMEIVDKIQLIYKRAIIGVIIIVLLVLILIDTTIIKQTIKAKDYIDTTATFVEVKETSDSEAFKDCIYTFEDKSGKQQEIIISISKDDEPNAKVKLKYNEKNPQEFYEEGSTMDKSGVIWYIVKIVVVILLVLLFFNKNLLNKINISTSRE